MKSIIELLEIIVDLPSIDRTTRERAIDIRCKFGSKSDNVNWLLRQAVKR